MNNNNMAPRTPIRNALAERKRNVLKRHPRIKVGDFINFYHISNGRMGSGQVLRKSGIKLPKFPGQNLWMVNNGVKTWSVPVSKIISVNVNSNNNW